MIGRFIVVAAMFTGLVGPADAVDDDGFSALRQRMIAQVRQLARLTQELHGAPAIDAQVLEVMATVPRHRFVPEPLRPLAYENRPLPVGLGQNIAQPFIIALMTSVARITPGDRIYETGTGAGYHAAILAELGARVFSIEVIAPLAERAGRLLQDLGYDNVEAREGDGYFGWPEKAPFDVILLKESVAQVPPPLLRQLKPGGRLVAPIGPPNGRQFLTLVEKGLQGELKRTRVLEVRFSPLQGGDRI